jgi:NAD(P)-dependent dehydrogenase (short-subunit alcohol dehydrogenase family)
MLQGKKVLLTGGTGGLGLGVTPTLLSQGADLTIPYLQEGNIQRLKNQLSSADFGKIRFVKTDLFQESLVEKLINDLGRIDVLIHLVGGFSMGPTDQFSFDAWKQSLDLNLNSTFLLCKYSLQKMKQHGYGRIVTVGSRGALQPGGQTAAYCAAKAGVVALTKAIAAEMIGTNITANVVLPSIIDTPTNREDMGSDQANQWVKPESLAEVICFLASEVAGDLRGAAIPVYGNC